MFKITEGILFHEVLKLSISIVAYRYLGSALNVIVITVGSEISNQSSNPGQGCLCFNLCLRERHESISQLWVNTRTDLTF